MAVSRALVAAALLCAACDTLPCRDKTAFVEIELSGAAAAADSLRLTYSVGGAQPKEETRPRTPGARVESIQINFPSGYPAGQTLSVSVRADVGLTPVGAGQGSVDLFGACASLRVRLGSGGKLLGETCQGGGCESGFCIDGICCDAPCDGQCEVCGSGGHCEAVTGAPAGARGACAGTGSTCGGTCDGVGRAACVYPTLQCRAGGCVAGKLVDAASCVAGACPAEVSRPCGLGMCQDATACMTVVSFDVGGVHSCAVLSDRTVRCWGSGQFNQLGQGANLTFRNVPTPVSGLTDIVEIASGLNHNCVRHADNTVSCWGYNNAGQSTGTGDTGTPRKVPAPVSSVRSLGLGDSHSCAVTTGNRAYCWGINAEGELGIGQTATITSALPLAVCPVDSTGACGAAFANNVSVITGGSYHTCLIMTDGGVACFGINNYGQTGQTGTASILNPKSVPLQGSTATAIDLGANSTCIVTATGGASCWGDNSNGALGNPGVGGSTLQPVTVCTNAACSTVLAGVQQLGYGGRTGCALRLGGALSCWGSNTYGEVGDGTTMGPRTFAVPHVITTGVTRVKIGFSSHGCALVGPEDLRCWGLNMYGELGNGDPNLANSATPVPVKWQ